MVRSRKEDLDEGRLETKEARQESAAEVAEGKAQREARGGEEVHVDLALRRVRPECRQLAAPAIRHDAAAGARGRATGIPRRRRDSADETGSRSECVSRRVLRH